MKVAVFVSGGGHLDEAMSVLEAFQGHEKILVTYDQKSLRCFSDKNFSKVYFFRLFASRGLGLYASLAVHLLECLWIFFKEQPQVLFSTGSEIALIPFYLGKLFGRRTIFLETVTRFESPSQTAKWIYPASDVFLVQWEKLLPFFGRKARYEGRVL